MNLVLFLSVLLLSYALTLDVVSDKTGEQQVKDALDKAEKESTQAAQEVKKNTNKTNDDNKTTKGNESKLKEDLNKIIAEKVEELAKLREKSKRLDRAVNKETTPLKQKDTSNLSTKSGKSMTTDLISAEEKEKENAKLEDESDKKMVDMAKKLNKLVLRFQKKMGNLNHLTHRGKSIDDSLNEETTQKDVRGKTATKVPSINLNALRKAMGLLQSGKVTDKKNADDSNAKTSYKEDVKLEDRLALEAEEEKKVSDGDTFDDDGAAEAAAGVDKSSTTTSSLSPKEQASQEMQSYNALISSESNRELSQIQEEISKATQTSMGKVSVVGQKEHVETENPTLPGLGDDPTLAALTGGTSPGGLEALGGASDPILQGLQGSSDSGLLSSAASNSEISAQQTTSLQDTQGITQQLGGEQQQQVGDSSAAGLGSQTPIEIGSSTPVDMGLLNTGSDQRGGSLQSPGETINQPMELQNSFMGQSQPAPMIDQGFNVQQAQQQQAMQFKKSKISNKQKKKNIINKFVKQKNYKRNFRKSKLRIIER